MDAVLGRDPRRDACDALARRLVTPDGLTTATLLERTRGAASDEGPPPPSAADVAETIAARYLGDTPAPIGIWTPTTPDTEDCDVAFERDAAATTRDWWPPHERLATKRSLLPLRVILLGESTAAGWFYAPTLTPATVLAEHLDASRGRGIYEVLDLTMVNQQAGDLVELAGAALQLAPDVLVVFAGNNWPQRLPSFPGATPADAARAADALRAEGMAGLRRVAEDATRTQVQDTLEILGRVADAGDVALVVVIPEVSVDWSRDRPVPWLPGDGAARWHAAHAKALGALEIGAWPAAAEAARAMLALDGGVSPTSHRLLGDALAASAGWTRRGRLIATPSTRARGTTSRRFPRRPRWSARRSSRAPTGGTTPASIFRGCGSSIPGRHRTTRSSSTTVTWRPTECAWPWAPSPPRSVGSSNLSRGRSRAAPRRARRW